ncbi:unnamed protein product [Fraxinus pennsylvanica]|uniref:Uncharacterized protein n=1 Tax=Fraxinus pennsylvanica TaxID=56036 RepID=A0AAD1ZW51_9LAMI|nr:unnamed protein product [Fraxinus pennsylvanica]
MIISTFSRKLDQKEWARMRRGVSNEYPLILEGYCKALCGWRGVNLGGVAIGNGLTDPGIQVATPAINAYDIGLINEKQKTLLEKLQSDAVGLTRNGNWSEAASARTSLEHSGKHVWFSHFI